jgi:hypothetical protein
MKTASTFHVASDENDRSRSSIANSGIARSSTAPVTSISSTPITQTASGGGKRKFVKALYQYDATDDDELTISPGDVIEVIEEIDEGWWIGETQDIRGVRRRGMFPANYCEVCPAPSWATTVEAPPPPRPSVPVPVPKQTSSSSYNSPVSSYSPSKQELTTARSDYGRQLSNTSAHSNRSTPPPRPTGAKPPIMRTTSATTTPSFSQISTAASAIARNPMSSVIMQAAAASQTASNTNIGPCKECGCDEFSPNVFKKGSCNNCFHKH